VTGDDRETTVAFVVGSSVATIDGKWIDGDWNPIVANGLQVKLSSPVQIVNARAMLANDDLGALFGFILRFDDAGEPQVFTF
jgi:hypothetical protein